MYAVEKYVAVRQFVFVEGKSRREAARFFGLSRDTVARMCLRDQSDETSVGIPAIRTGAALDQQFGFHQCV